MANLISLDQAAAILGMTVEQITELRSNNEIFGYRDGASWKFKMTELERVAADLDLKMNLDAVAAPAIKDVQESAELNLGDSSDDFLVDDSSDELIEEDSSVELMSRPLSGAESALNLGDSGEISLSDSGIDLSSSGIDLEGSGLSLSDSGLSLTDSGLSIADSGLNLQDSSEGLSVIDGDDEDLAFGSSSLRLAGGSSKKLTGNDTGDLLDDVEEGSDSPSDTGKMLGASDGDDLLLSDDDLFADDMSLADSGSFEDSAELSSDFEDSDLIMEDSDSSTEIVLEANDSGINLSPNESGIALDDSLELGGSDIDSLELPEDDEDIVMVDEPADQDVATIMQEDDFNLTPLEEAVEGESSSQIIALEDSEIYADESSATILADSADIGGEPAMLEDSMGFDADPYGAAGLAPAGMSGGVEVTPEAPYTLYQVLSLGAVTALLTLGSMVAYDLARNMWMPEDQVISSGVLKIFLGLVGMD